MGGLTLIGSCGGLILQPFMESFVEQVYQNMPGPQQQIQQQMAMQHEIMAVQIRWRPWLIGGVVLQTATVVLLLVGCIKGLGLKRGAPRWLLAAMICGILQALLQAGLTWGMQRETAAIMSRHMAQMMQSTPGAPMPPGMPQMMSGMMNFSTSLSILFIAAWGLAKIGYFGYSICYLSTAGVRRLFEPDQPPTTLPPAGPPSGPAAIST
jgi:hypothetical protein